MARINLLPWREQLREERKQRFLVTLAAVAGVCVALLLLVGQGLDSAVEAQAARNNLLRKEIAQLDGRIAEIGELRAQRQQLLERMKVIQDLQGNRPVTARVFDQILRTLPDGVYFTSLKMVGSRIAITGVAQTNERVSTLMRNLDASDWLQSASLSEVKTFAPGTAQFNNQFQLSVIQTQPPLKEAQP